MFNKKFKPLKAFGQGMSSIKGLITWEKNKGQGVEAEKMRCRYDLKHLCEEYLGYGDWDTIHDDIYKFLEFTDKRFKLLLIPRGHLKSSVVTKAYSIQLMLRHPNIRILLANAIWDNARGFLRTITKYLEPPQGLAKYFGSFKPTDRASKSSWNKDEVIVNQRDVPQDAPTIATTGVERTQASQHYDVIVMDDVVVRENIGTPEQRQKIKNFYTDCLSLLEPDGLMIVIGTTWHEDDLYNGLRADEDFDIFIRKAEQGTEKSVIFPKKFTLEILHKLRSKDKFQYSAQYLLDPYPEEDMEFKKRWIQEYKQIPEEPMYVSLCIDPSLGRNEKSDFSAIACTGITPSGKVYVFEARQFRRKVEDIPEEVIKTVRMLKTIGIVPNVIGLETFGFQMMMYEPLKEALRKAQIDIYVHPLPKTNDSKENRIRSLIPKFAGYDVYLRQGLTDLKAQLLRFSTKVSMKYDDIIDALAWNVYFWDRKPGELKAKREIKEFSFKWWEQRAYKPHKEKDLFMEYRK